MLRSIAAPYDRGIEPISPLFQTDAEVMPVPFCFPNLLLLEHVSDMLTNLPRRSGTLKQLRNSCNIEASLSQKQINLRNKHY